MSVRMRPITLADADRVLAWRNSFDVSRYMYSDHLISSEEHHSWLVRVLGAEDRLVWIIEWLGTPVGLAALNQASADAGRCDWAFYLADPEVRGQGLGACVEYLVLRHAFERLQIHKLWCEVFLENEAVWRMHLSFGFKREADLRDHVFKGGRHRDVVGLGFLASEWPRQKPALEARLSSKGLLATSVLVGPEGP